LEFIKATVTNGGGLGLPDSITTVINTIEQTSSTTKLHSPVICDIKVTLVSEQSTELSKGHEVVSSRFRTVEYCLPKTELLKTEVVPSPGVAYILSLKKFGILSSTK
jgi:hypothetical protein